MSEFYGGYLAAYNGLDEVRALFHKRGLSSTNSPPEQGDTYPGNLDLYDFITSSAHEKRRMIEL